MCLFLILSPMKFWFEPELFLSTPLIPEYDRAMVVPYSSRFYPSFWVVMLVVKLQLLVLQ
ncbi:hypothetical protein Gorai_022386 [Gossypium raimondii]|uniref:Uncharacterized protein n=1 Tax=Gossypium raimondii TaxID=29730 RepID=A0A7J8NT41_GOSRA|nr:hypothetical protein [Gossypium raimondii]